MKFHKTQTLNVSSQKSTDVSNVSKNNKCEKTNERFIIVLGQK